MKKKIMQTRFKVLLNNLLIESQNYVKVKVFYNNGLVFKVLPIENTEINKFLIKI